jgi:hypothetical protein
MLQNPDKVKSSLPFSGAAVGHSDSIANSNVSGAVAHAKPDRALSFALVARDAFPASSVSFPRVDFGR